jgi:hypothetical protein
MGFNVNMQIHKFCEPPTVPGYQRWVAAMMDRIASSLQRTLDENSVLTIWKDGVWHPYGKCCGCNDLGPHHFHSKRCAKHGLLCVRGPYPYVEVGGSNPPRLGTIPNTVHTTLAAEPNPEAARSHFLLLLASLWLVALP